MNSGTVIGACVTGILLFLSALLVPIITRKANKSIDASESAKRSADTAEVYTKTALALVDGVEKQLVDSKKQCAECLSELGAMKRALNAVHAALVGIVPLLVHDEHATQLLLDAIRTLDRARHRDD